MSFQDREIINVWYDSDVIESDTEDDSYSGGCLIEFSTSSDECDNYEDGDYAVSGSSYTSSSCSDESLLDWDPKEETELGEIHSPKRSQI